MPTPTWKDKFTQQQLTKKRINDKINQRRLRKQCKEETAELERRLALLEADTKGTLINCLLDDNAALRAKIHKYQTGFRDILATGKDCLDADEATHEGINDPCLQEPAKSDSTDGFSPQESTSGEPSKNNTTTILGRLETSESRFTTTRFSVYFQLSHILGVPEEQCSNIPTNSLLESIMAWRTTKSSSKDGLELLVSHFSRDSDTLNLTIDEIHRQALSPNLFPDILEWLLYERDISYCANSTEDTPLQLSNAERQRRAIAYYAYQKSLPCKKLFKSALERIVMFWADYKCFLFFVFPTAENYENIPTWRRPTPSQFQVDHPGMLDFLAWPRLRAHLLTSWPKYDLDDLYLKLFQSFEIRRPPEDLGTVVRLNEDMSDLYLTKSFENSTFSIDNFRVDSRFAEYYPELAHLVVPETSSTQPSLQSTSGAGSKRVFSKVSDMHQEHVKRRHKDPISAQLCNTVLTKEMDNAQTSHDKALQPTTSTCDFTQLPNSMAAVNDLSVEEGKLVFHGAERGFSADITASNQYANLWDPESTFSVPEAMFSSETQSFDYTDYQFLFLSTPGFNQDES
ncbi:hypothetical protein FDECE_3453 [Fusarium decemcellulare]|nr:hypothetical protein FDECE_3453 [Fusarium decemcellulare]